MTQYSTAFDIALNTAMKYEVGSFWNLETPGVREGLIKTAAQRKAVGYVNDPSDRGGETKYGIAANANPDLDIKTLDWDAACRVYYKRYWVPADCNEISSVAPRLAVLHFDGCVNHGISRASKFLQQAVNASSDGDIGPATLTALSVYMKLHSEAVICNKICDLREQFYRDIVSRNPSQQKFLKGWLRRISEMRTLVLDQTKNFV